MKGCRHGDCIKVEEHWIGPWHAFIARTKPGISIDLCCSGPCRALQRLWDALVATRCISCSSRSWDPSKRAGLHLAPGYAGFPHIGTGGRWIRARSRQCSSLAVPVWFCISSGLGGRHNWKTSIRLLRGHSDGCHPVCHQGAARPAHRKEALRL